MAGDGDRGGGEAVEIAALVVRLSVDGDPLVVHAALEALGHVAALEVAVDAGRVVVDHGTLTVGGDEPALDELKPSLVRSIHRALAEALGDGPLLRRRRRADHLVAATLLPDEAVAVELAALAAELRAADAIPEAAARWQQAAAVSPVLADRARRLREAGEALWLLSRTAEAGIVLLEAFAATDDTILRADIAVILGQIELWTRGPRHALAVLLPTADAVAAIDPDRGAILLVHATTTSLLSLDADAGLRFARRAEQLAAAGSGAVGPAAQVSLAVALTLHGDAEEAARILGPLDELAWSMLDAEPGAIPELEHLLNVLGLLATMVERWDRGEAYLERVAFRARNAESESMLAVSVGILAELRFRSGRLDDAERLLGGGGGATERITDAVFRTWMEALRLRNAAVTGALPAARIRTEALAASMEGRRLDAGMATLFARHALALVELADGDAAAAASHLDEVAALVAAGSTHEPGVAWWQGDHVEALWRSGRRHEARAAAERLEADAVRTGRASAAAAAARCRALVAADHEAMEVAAAEAVAGWMALPAPFEVGRTLLVRAQRRAELGEAEAAAADAAEAAVLFERLGARPWVDVASSLVAAADPLAALTEAERRVATAVAGGARNRAVAEQLFLSERTVEAHLERIYRKLGVENRTQLATIVNRRP